MFEQECFIIAMTARVNIIVNATIAVDEEWKELWCDWDSAAIMTA